MTRIIGITITGLLLWLAIYAYKQRPQTLSELIDRSNQELVEHKMGQLYGQ